MKKIESFIYAFIIYLSIVILSISIVFLNSFSIYSIAFNLYESDYRFEYGIEEGFADVENVINYTLGNEESLKLENYTLSENASIHFAEVRDIFLILKKVSLVSIISILLISLIGLKKKSYICKISMGITIGVNISLIVVILLMKDFFYELVHKIIFQNDYWIFDTTVDNIINILPQSYFILCLVFILAAILILNIIFCLFYRKIVSIY